MTAPSEMRLDIQADVATWIQTVDVSQFSPPSPDTSGIAYLPNQNTLLLADSEVNEMPIFTGDNLFEMSLNGTLNDTSTTLPFSDEPTGADLNAANNHLFISDDTGTQSVYEVDPGPDGLHGTPDDSVTSFSTIAFGNADPEGVTYDPVEGVLYITDGLNNEIYRVDPGTNQIFDGVAPAGDDQVTNFDTSGLGVLDPEGIIYDTTYGHLYLVGNPGTLMAHLTTDGTLVRMIDISAAGALNPSGLAYAPSSVNPAEMSIYITERGIDNNTDPNENDGKVYELSIPPLNTTNQAPIVDAGPNQAVIFSDSVQLDGMVSDDGLPNPPNMVKIGWSQVSGPGTVTFGDANLENTTATFSEIGIYILRLTAKDGELESSDEMVVTVVDSSTVTTTQIQVAASSDDAEETAAMVMQLTSPDLDLAQKPIAARFAGLNIPADAMIIDAHVQFTADKVNATFSSVTIQGEAADDASTFTVDNGNITSRATTSTAVAWSIPEWVTIGDAGPAQQTPDVAAIIQEIVDRPGWTDGNAMVLILSGSGGLREAVAWDKTPAQAPVLHVEFIDLSQINEPPSVNAGPDQIITLPDGAMLDGTVTDDGLPNPPGAVTTTWNQVSGPGTAAFANASAEDTTVTFDVAGIYVLRLTADDGHFTPFDEISITVEDAFPINEAPTVSAGPDQVITLPDIAVLDGTVTDDGLPNPPGVVSLNWSQVSGTGTATFGSPNAEDTKVEFDMAGTYVLRLMADDSELITRDEVIITVNPAGPTTILEANFDSNEDGFAYIDDAFRSTNQPKYANGEYAVSDSFSGGGLLVRLGGVDGADILGMSGGWQQSFTLSEPTEIHLSFYYNLIQASNYEADEYSQALLSVSGVLYGTPPNDYIAQINGNGNGGGAESTGWQQFKVNLGTLPAGPHTFIIGGFNNKKTYTDEMTEVLIDQVLVIGETPTNELPSVDAGPDQTLTLPNGITLDGTVTDDGLPIPPGTLTISWSQVSGPGTATFGSASAEDTAVTFDVAGTYVLRLTADDGELAAFDEVSVIVYL